MTAALHHFPTPPALAARMAAQDEAVTLARRIIRSKINHGADDLRLACGTLMTYGDSFDRMDGYHVLRALDARPEASQKAAAMLQRMQARRIDRQETALEVAMRYRAEWPVIVAGGVVGALVVLGWAGWLG